MNELSPRTRALIDVAREAAAATTADRTRVRQSIAHSLASPASTAPPAATAWGPSASLIMGLGVVVGASLALIEPTSEVRSITKRIDDQVVASGAPSVAAVLETSIHEPLPTESAPMPQVHRVRAPRRDRNQEASEPVTVVTVPRIESGEEVGRLLAARSRLQIDPEGALETAREHLTRFPSGNFREDARCLEVLALCRARRADGPGAADRFRRDFPRSAYVLRVRQACAETTDSP